LHAKKEFGYIQIILKSWGGLNLGEILIFYPFLSSLKTNNHVKPIEIPIYWLHAKTEFGYISII